MSSERKSGRADSEKKSAQERGLFTVRSHIGAALETLSKAPSGAASPGFFARVFTCKQAPPSADAQVHATLRKELEQAEIALKSMEVQMGEQRLLQAAWNPVTHFKHVEDKETREWLMHTFEHGRRVSDKNDSDDDSKEFQMGHSPTNHAYLDSAIREAMSDQSVAKLMEKAAAFDFDALAFSTHPVVCSKPIAILGVKLEQKFRLTRRIKDSVTGDAENFQKVYLGFLNKLDELYKPDAIYHGSMHAVDVMSTTMWFMQSEYMVSHSKPMDIFMTLTAAAIHDVGHPGVNNLFLTKTMNPLALRYNDRSVLESMHAALAFETMSSNDDCNWYRLLDPASQKVLRPGLIGMVLATDMATHASMVQKMATFHLVPEKERDHKFMLETVLHASDISNPAKPLTQMLGWTKRITEEFWVQGDMEQKLNLEISPLCDREAGMKSVPKGQIGFIDFVVTPYLTAIRSIIPDAQVALDGLATTKAHWQKANADGVTFEQIFADAP